MLKTDLKDINISIGKKVTTSELSIFSLDNYVRGIVYGWQEDTIKKIIDIRNSQDKKERDELKKTLPYAVWQGIFKERKSDSLIIPSNLLYIDIDKKDIEKYNEEKKTNYNAVTFKDFLINNKENEFHKYILFCGLSCSATGIFIIVQADYNLDKDSYSNLHEALKDIILLHIGINIDKTSDIARANIVTYDPNLYINENHKLITNEEFGFNNIILESLNTIDSNEYPNKFKKKIIEDIYKHFSQNKTSITQTYNDLLLIGLALFTEFSATIATKYFHLFASLDERYDKIKTDARAKSIKKNNKKKVSYKTIIHIAKQYGYVMTENLIVNTSNDKIPVAIVFGNWYDSKEYYIKEYIPSNKMFHCKRNDETYCQELTSSYMQQIMTDFIVETNRSINTTAFLSYAYIDKKIEKIYVFDNYFKNLAPYDSENESEIEKLYDLLKLKKHNISNNIFSFASFFIGGYANIIMHHKKYNVPKYCSILTLVSEQGFGKTTFFDCICPEEFRESHYTKDFGKFSEKDDMEQLKNCFIILDDEGNTQTNKSANTIKAATSKSKVNYRRPYEKLTQDFDVVAIFGLCTNNHDFLKDVTGNRRYNIYELIERIDFDKLKNININRLWAEAKYRYENGEKWYYNSEEIKEINTANEQYMVKDYVEHLIPIAISQDNLDEKNPLHWHTYAEIIQHLKHIFPNTSSLNNINSHKIKYYFKDFDSKIFKIKKIRYLKIHCILLDFEKIESNKHVMNEIDIDNDSTTVTMENNNFNDCPF